MSDYRKQLELASFPEEILVLDFENFFDSDYSLTKMSTIEYIVDPRFEFTGVGWAVSPNFHAVFSHSVDSAIRGLQTRYGQNLEQITVVVANGRYDITVLKEKFDIEPPYIVDILDLARHFDSRMSHSVADLAKLFKLENKGDTSQFKGLHLKDMDEVKLRNLAEYCKLDIRIEAKLFKLLMEKLTWPEIELPVARHTLGLYLNPLFNFDFVNSAEVLEKMETLLAEVIEPSGCDKKLWGSKLAFPIELQKQLDLHGELEKVPYKQGKNELIPALSKTDEAFQALQVHPRFEVREMCISRQAVKSWPTHIKRIKSMRAQASASFGQLRIPLNYYGCHTGRPTGGEKINVLNLGGKGRAGQGTHKLISMVRKLLLAPPGMILVIDDSAQIECRLSAWLVGQENLVTGFKNGEDIYSDFASLLFGVEVRKPTDAEREDPSLKEWCHEQDMMRGFGKDAILGAGYGMGATRFYNNCRSNPDLRPFFDDGTYTFAFIERLIKTYRTTYSKIPEFWKRIEALFKFVIKFPNETAYYSLDSAMFDAEASGTLLTLWNDNGTVCIMLPSGRVLYYRHSSIGMDGGIRWQWGHLWGGSLIENIIQSIARDMLMIWILECEKEGIPIATHCYDELVGVVPEEEGEVCLELMSDIMCEVPEWAPGVPLAAEGMLSRFYTK